MRLIVVDDDRLVVDSLKIILGVQPQIEVVGTGANGNDAVALYAEHAPAGGAGARAGGESAAKRLDALAHGAEPHALRGAAAACLDPARAIIGDDELVKRRMLHAPYGDGLGASVAHGVGERLAQDRRKAVGDVCGRMFSHNFKLNLRTAVRARAFNNAFELHGKVDGVVVERVDAGAHKLERLVNRVLDVGEIGGDAGLVGVDHAQGFGLQ